MLSKYAAFAALLLWAGSSQAAEFRAISSIESTTQATDLAPASNLIQGPGVGFDANEPHDQITAGFFDQWVTADDAGFPSDYITEVGMPVLMIDLGLDVLLSEISVWGYSETNANGVSEFGLRFATEADTPVGFGSSIVFNPTYSPTTAVLPRQSFAFGQDVSARYVEFTVTDNFYEAPGDASLGGLPGGDRVGLGRIAFAQPAPAGVPEPGVLALLGLGLAVIGFSRRKTD